MCLNVTAAICVCVCGKLILRTHSRVQHHVVARVHRDVRAFSKGGETTWCRALHNLVYLDLHYLDTVQPHLSELPLQRPQPVLIY